jgi:formylglycine-generating enzyme required for sulfatase activity
MGSPLSDSPRAADETPHYVELTQAYYIGVCEVTQGQFHTVMQYNPSYFSAKGGGSAKVEGQDTTQHSVDNLTWEAADSFCKVLSDRPAEQQAGRKYRLPTEAEWEYACRAGSQGPYHFGQDVRDLGLHAWFQENSDGRTHPVKHKEPNQWKLYDMHGNVWEWCEDYYDADFYRKSPDKDPICTTPTKERVLRGGGWGVFGSAFACRCAKRGHSAPLVPQSYHGLRVVFTVPAVP